MNDRLQNAVAIIGIAGRFPEAENVEQFWQNLCTGRESIRRIAERDLEDGLTAEQRGQGNYVAARALLENVDRFDAEFFHLLPREAELTDPQQRMLMECAWEAMEDAGYDALRTTGNVGVFAGSSINTYLLLHLAADPAFRAEFTRAYQVGSFAALVGNGQDFLATRISYKLNLRGPAMTVQSACSTSLLAVAQAWQSLVNYQSDMALAGGVSISFPQSRGYFHQEGGMVSPDGHCRPFDAAAAGTVFGAGAGMVLLKRAEEAIADGDHIYALLLGAGVNNDGSDKVGYAAPSSQGQADAIATAYAVAGVDPATVDYVECHGTGTPLGDPIEVAALAQAFRQGGQRASPCLIGSAKGNVGHLDIASGIAGLTKAALSLDRERIPGTLHYSEPNPQLDLAHTPFQVSSTTTAWPRGNTIRRAGVSAFGVGGTNVHVVLEEAPVAASKPTERSKQVLCLSARTRTALEAQCVRLADHLERAKPGSFSLPDVAYTLALGRRAFPHRLTVPAGTREEAIAQLRSETTRSRATVAGELHGVAMLFPGQGTQYPGMGEDLYRTEPSYRQVVDDCCERLKALAGLDLLPVMFPKISEVEDTQAWDEAVRVLEQTRYAQPALFVTSYALAKLWMQWGVQPACLVGHSVGELVAACVAGVFSLEDALLFVARRGEWMQEMPPGSMVAVRMQSQQLQAMLPGNLSIAAINSPKLTVISGPTVEMELFCRQLEKEKFAFRQLHTSHAFHSAMVEPVVARLQELLGEMKLDVPKIRIISTVTGSQLTDAEATSAAYWARHSRVCVDFNAAASTLIQEGHEVLLEAGAGETLITLVRQQLPAGKKTIGTFSSLPAGDLHRSESRKSSWDVLAASIGAVWSRGVAVDWVAYYASEQRSRVSLPTYPFERKRYWVESKQEVSADMQTVLAAAHVSSQAYKNNPSQNGNSIAANLNPLEKQMTPITSATPDNSASSTQQDRAAGICQGVAALLEDLSGLELAADQYDMSFLELGFDSLFLTQAAQKIQNQYAVKIAFRQLLDNLNSIRLVADYLDQQLPQGAGSVSEVKEMKEVIGNTLPSAIPANSGSSASFVPPSPLQAPSVADGQIAILMQQQLQAVTQLIQSQLQILNGGPAASPANAPTIQPVPQPVEAPVSAPVAAKTPESHVLLQQPNSGGKHVLTAEQERYLAELSERYCSKTAQSKAFTQKHRRTLADPRVVNGFRSEWKEMIYSLVSSRSKGSKLWDIDGNEYIDLLNGFGPTMFGHAPEFVTQAIRKQMGEGFAIGPQTPLAGEAADLLTQLTGTERVTFCNTGSEAVMAAMRLARTVTGRDRVVFFAGDYHGQFDEVLARQLKRKGEFRVQPAAPGIPSANLGNITVLDYGTDEALHYIEQHANELAAVLIEPVQSRHPNLQPKEFLLRVREITRQSETAFIFDEVVTGFRIHPRGAQGYYGIDADMVSYGKVIGGGMPIGVLAGKASFMDALDGGQWKFGDASVPEVGVTFFAGTFVRHPLTMAALCATLKKIQEEGSGLYERLNQSAAGFMTRMNELFTRLEVPLHLEGCGSVMYLGIPHELHFGGLLFYLLREKGIFILEGFPLYLTTEHSDADLDRILRAFEESIVELQSHGLLPVPMEVGAPGAAEVKTERSEQKAQAGTTAEIPLTEPQLEIMLAAQVSDEAACAFNESFRVRLEGVLDMDALKRSWQSIVDRHDALRMSLVPARDKMRDHPGRTISIEDVDLTGTSSHAQQKSIENMLAAEGIQPFDLVQGPLVRAHLLKLAPESHLLLVTAHHLVCDGWTVNLLVDELGKTYSALLHNSLPELARVLSFSQYAMQVQQSEWRAQEKSDLAFWKQKLTPEPEVLTLPSDRNRSGVRSFAGSTYFAEFPKDFVTSLRKTGAEVGCTLFTTLLAGWQILLWRLSGNADPVTMIPAAAQSLMDDAVLMGHCVHLLPIRAELDPAMKASDYLRTLKPVVLDAHEHQHATYGSIVRALAPRREPGRLPLSEVQFNLEQVGRGAAFGGLKTDVRANGKRAVNFDLFLNIVDTGNGLRLECDYSTALYDESTIARWLECYQALLASMIADPTQSVGSLEMLKPELRTFLLETCNATATGPQPAENVPELIAAAFASMPEQPAADFYGQRLTRAELAERSDRLASWLIRNGAGPDALVGIYMDRSLDMLVAMLGVLKAGAAYVPLDPMFPPTRIAQIVEETHVPVMITLSGNVEGLPPSQAYVLALDEQAAMLANEPMVELPKISGEARAYVIFTSGSTGRPKGVEVCHGAVVNLLTDNARRMEMTPKDRWLAVTTLSFDIAVLEMLLPLVSGGTVVIAQREDVTDGAQLMELVQATRATALQATPVTWRMLLEQGFQPELGFKMMCGGEAWTPSMADQLLAHGGRLWNMYGPTETTVWSSITEVERGMTRMTIGPPIANTQFYVMDARLQPVPPGVSGELFIAGDGVARGYFDRAELTAEKFLPNPFRPGERMYRTGDEVRQLPDGRIEFLGRLDHQIKLRGYRIELGEVETGLRALPGVRDAVAVLRPDASGEAILVGYYTGGEDSSPAELKRILSSQLLAYMVPTVLKHLDSLPLTPNGKIDRRALPEPRTGSEVEKEEYVAPTTPTETVLAEIFSEVMGCPRISIRASLLDLGADSLRMFQIASRAHHRGLDVSATQLMQYHTVEAVAAVVDAAEARTCSVAAPSLPLRRVSREAYRMRA